jgi:hypothetical protein
MRGGAGLDVVKTESQGQRVIEQRRRTDTKRRRGRGKRGEGEKGIGQEEEAAKRAYLIQTSPLSTMSASGPGPRTISEDNLQPIFTTSFKELSCTTLRATAARD